MPDEIPAESDLSALLLLLVHNKFPLSQLMATPYALSQLEQSDIQTALLRHARGDWGELDKEDNAANDLALIEGTRLLSSYYSKQGIKFWIITEADRSVTTVLLPEDYWKGAVHAIFLDRLQGNQSQDEDRRGSSLLFAIGSKSNRSQPDRRLWNWASNSQVFPAFGWKLRLGMQTAWIAYQASSLRASVLPCNSSSAFGISIRNGSAESLTW